MLGIATLQIDRPKNGRSRIVVTGALKCVVACGEWPHAWARAAADNFNSSSKLLTTNRLTSIRSGLFWQASCPSKGQRTPRGIRMAGLERFQPRKGRQSKEM